MQLFIVLGCKYCVLLLVVSHTESCADRAGVLNECLVLKEDLTEKKFNEHFFIKKNLMKKNF